MASLHPDNLCYAIHTSGSTGDPKAVAVSYRQPGLRHQRAGARVPRSPTATGWRSWPPWPSTPLSSRYSSRWRAGPTLMLPPPGTMAPVRLLRYIERRRVTVLDLTPAYWHQLLALTGPADERLRSVRLMITGGEMADPADCQAALRAAPGARLLNAYGLTETTITSALFDVGAGPEAHSRRPARCRWASRSGHARIMVLDEKLNPVPAGTVGRDLHRRLRGRPGLPRPPRAHRGTVPARRRRRPRQPDVPHRGPGPLAGGRQPGGRRARWTASSRCAASASSPGRSRACWPGTRTSTRWRWWRPSQGPGDTRLVAYYTPTRRGGRRRRRHHPPSAASLRRYLLARLPGYMIPAAFVALDRMPLTPERTSQPRAALRASAGRPAPPGHEPARQRRTPQRARRRAAALPVAGLAACGRLLQQVGLDDDFFALGGDSLLAAEMLAHTRAMFGIAARLCARSPAACCATRRCAGSPGRAGRPRGQAGRGRRRGPRSTSPARPKLDVPASACDGGPASPAAGLAQARARYCSPERPGSSARTCCSELLATTDRAGLVPGPGARRRAHALTAHHGRRRALRARRPARRPRGAAAR